MNIESLEHFKTFHNCRTGRIMDLPGGNAKSIVDESTLGVVNFVHVDVGKYNLTSNGLFKNGLTEVTISNEADGYLQHSIIDESTIEVNVLTEEFGSGINNRLFAVFQILVWHSEQSKAAYIKAFG